MMRLSQAITTSATRRPLSYRSPIIFADKKISLGASSFHPNHFSPSFRSLKIGKDIHVIYRSTRWLLWWRFCEIGLPDDSNIDRSRAPLFTHWAKLKVQRVQYVPLINSINSRIWFVSLALLKVHTHTAQVPLICADTVFKYLEKDEM